MKGRRQRGRAANPWPRWKLFAYLPDRRRWSALRLVQLAERGHPWQFQTLAGASAFVGLFASRESALRWAKAHCERVVEADRAAGGRPVFSGAGALRSPDPIAAAPATRGEV